MNYLLAVPFLLLGGVLVTVMSIGIFMPLQMLAFQRRKRAETDEGREMLSAFMAGLYFGVLLLVGGLYIWSHPAVACP